MKRAHHLKKELTFWDVFCLASGAMISSGLFVLPGIAHEKVGPALFLAYFFAGLLALTGVFSQAELVSAMPKSGGAYFFVTRSLGPGVGTIQGLLNWFSLLLKAAFALVGIDAFAKLVFPQLAPSMEVIPWPGLLLALFFIGLNLTGAKKAGRMQVYLVVFLFIALIVYLCFGFSNIDVHHFVPFTPAGFESVFVIAGFIFVAYGGVLKVASVAEEVHQAEKTVPQAMIASLVVVMIFYSLVVFVTTGMLGGENLNGSLVPLSVGAEASMGQWGMVLLSLAAIASFITTANAGLLAASRYPMALSRDQLLPEFLSKLHPQFKTPIASIVVSGVLLIGCLFLKLDILVELASTVLILTFILSHLSVLIMRESKVHNYQPVFKSPFYPWIQIAGIVFFLFILFEMSHEVFFIKVLLIGMAFLTYWFYGRIRTEKKFALLHIIERITARELVTGELERELKEIIRERDEIIKDRFDHMVEDCVVLDIDHKIKVDELFAMAAERIEKNEKVSCSRDTIELALLKREREATTVISDHVAIPHVVVEGDHVFDVILVRCKEGVIFDDEHYDVDAVFILYGSSDERSFHLRSLAAIAQIVSNASFHERWLSARHNQSLRDVMLLSKRKRFT